MKKIIITLLISIALCTGSAIAAGDRHISAKLTIYLAGINKPIAEYTNVYYTIENGCIHIFDRLGPGAHMTTYSLGAFGFKSERE
ncbi:MAG: hypothetical protein MJY98_03280 [Fibrobacter sp.]|nr:hypothetical protein [Fibrobacter sp.]